MAANRWRRNPEDFATRFDVEDLRGFFQKRLIVEMDTRAIILVDGRSLGGEVGPGPYTMRTFRDALTSPLGWEQTMTALLVDAGEVSRLVQVDLRPEVPLIAEVHLVVQLDDALSFFRNLMKGQPRYTLDQLQNYLEPEVRNAVKETVKGVASDQLQGYLHVKKELDLNIAAHLDETQKAVGLKFHRVRALDVFEPNEGGSPPTSGYGPVPGPTRQAPRTASAKPAPSTDKLSFQGSLATGLRVEGDYLYFGTNRQENGKRVGRIYAARLDRWPQTEFFDVAVPLAQDVPLFVTRSLVVFLDGNGIVHLLDRQSGGLSDSVDLASSLEQVVRVDLAFARATLDADRDELYFPAKGIWQCVLPHRTDGRVSVQPLFQSNYQCGRVTLWHEYAFWGTYHGHAYFKRRGGRVREFTCEPGREPPCWQYNEIRAAPAVWPVSQNDIRVVFADSPGNVLLFSLGTERLMAAFHLPDVAGIGAIGVMGKHLFAVGWSDDAQHRKLHKAALMPGRARPASRPEMWELPAAGTLLVNWTDTAIHVWIDREVHVHTETHVKTVATGYVPAGIPVFDELWYVPTERGIHRVSLDSG